MFPARVAVGASPPLWGRERSPGTEATRSGHAVRPRGRTVVLQSYEVEVAAKSSTCPARFSQIVLWVGTIGTVVSDPVSTVRSTVTSTACCQVVQRRSVLSHLDYSRPEKMAGPEHADLVPPPAFGSAPLIFECRACGFAAATAAPWQPRPVLGIYTHWFHSSIIL